MLEIVQTVIADIVSKNLMNELFAKENIGKVHSVFLKACNFLCGGQLVGLVSPEIGVNPFSIVFSAPEENFWRNNFKNDIPVEIKKHQIFIGTHLIIDLHAAKIWDPVICLSILDLDKVLLRLTVELKRILSPSTFLENVLGYFSGIFFENFPSNFYWKKLSKFLDIFFTKKVERVISLEIATGSLIGLGEGLTPSGDDFLAGLVGILNVIHRESPLKWEWERKLKILNQCLLDAIAANKTTLVSNMLLKSASNGWFCEKVQNFLLNLVEEKDNLEDSLKQVLSIGHNSGSDMLAGIFTGFQLLKTRKNDLCLTR
jgi:hypothetical protein